MDNEIWNAAEVQAELVNEIHRLKDIIKEQGGTIRRVCADFNDLSGKWWRLRNEHNKCKQEAE